ncbi:hypothetical protein GCM10007385_20810 [Tateyamaria omphalii]|uniref:hypothetical protein n=1 Tax=Tateyamaria omphalii TaxID=299262 RepID=UPI001674514C|nr:hypothetical protein [Tateyamaria omphalii]GGX51985.1 hypothetical protein GCM10007385_20810 [Tateyamaria omphalii]
MKTDDKTPDPYTVNYIGTYLRNYAIFGSLAAIGARMMRAAVKNEAPLSAIDLGRLVGLSEGIMIWGVGLLTLLTGLGLCFWNAGSAIMDILKFHKVPPNAKDMQLIKAAGVFVFIVLGIAVPFYAGVAIFGFYLRAL